VDTPRLDSKERPTLTVQELHALIDVIKDDRDGHQHQLGSLGLRKQELAGLCWEHIDLEAHRMRIVRTRTIVDAKVIIGQPKKERSKLDVPIPDPVYSSLLHARAVKRQEMSPAVDRYRDSGLVFVNELGDPVHPDYLTDRWKAACARLAFRH